jgi:hypothetical protein
MYEMDVMLLGGQEMKKWVVLLTIMTMGSLGCSLLTKVTSQITSQTGEAASIPLQTFDGNGVTFRYPQSWEEIDPESLSVYVTDYTYLAVFADKDDSKGTLARFVIVQTDQSFADYIAGEKNIIRNSMATSIRSKKWM